MLMIAAVVLYASPSMLHSSPIKQRCSFFGIAADVSVNGLAGRGFSRSLFD